MKYNKFLTGAFACFALASCNQENYLLYEDVARLQFGPDPKYLYRAEEKYVLGDTLQNYTFIYQDESVTEDTVWFHLHTMGNVSGEDRTFRLEQIQMEEGDNAVSGTHYKAFDSPEMAKYYVIHKDSAHQLVPVVMLRDPSLLKKKVRLRFQVVANEHFRPGASRLVWREMVFTDKYSKPNQWSDYYFKEYGDVKIEFMVQQSGLRWDDACFSAALEEGAMPFWSLKFKELLLIRNREAVAAGKPELAEEDGRKVEFP